MKKVYTRRAICRGHRPWQFHIAITSPTGTGGSTLMANLKDALESEGWYFFSAGEYMRKLQREQKFATVEAVTAHNANDSTNDLLLDAETRRLVALNEKIIVESRVGKLWMPHAYHVLLVCPMHVRADRRKENKKDRIEAFRTCHNKILYRDIDDSERYDRLYPGHNWDKGDYDLVIHTDVLSPKQVLNKVLEGHEQWWRRQKVKDSWFPAQTD